MAQSKRTNSSTKDIKIFILVAALATTIAGWAGLANQNTSNNTASTTPAIQTVSNRITVDQPAVRRAAPAPLTTTRSSR